LRFLAAHGDPLGHDVPVREVPKAVRWRIERAKLHIMYLVSHAERVYRVVEQ